MSAKRSWDVPRNARAAPGGTENKRASLKQKRKLERQRFFIILGIISAALIGAAVYLLWQPSVRVQNMHVAGVHDEEIQSLAADVLSGTHGFVIPRDSIFFYPETELRRAILEAHADIAAVKIEREAFTSIAITPIERVSAFMWCGEHSTVEDDVCYDADAEGLVFREGTGEVVTESIAAAEAPVEPAAGIMAMKRIVSDEEPEAELEPAEELETIVRTLYDQHALRIYAPLETVEGSDGSPIRRHVIGSERIPEALRFVKAVRSFGVSVDAISIQGDEAHIITDGGTRLTYVLGKEEESATLAKAALPTLNLSDGSVDYVDLRFPPKVYVKRHGE
jgi:hypothetical protein